MGIKKLMSCVNALDPSLIRKEEIPPNSLLIVDGNGWCYHLVRKLNSTYSGRVPMNSLLGGLYRDFDAFIRQEIKFLREACGLRLKVFMDGSETRMKGATALKRRMEREEKWSTMHMICSDNQYLSSQEAFLPFPKLCVEQFISTLINCGVEIGILVFPTSSFTSIKIKMIRAS